MITRFRRFALKLVFLPKFKAEAVLKSEAKYLANQCRKEIEDYHKRKEEQRLYQDEEVRKKLLEKENRAEMLIDRGNVSPRNKHL